MDSLSENNQLVILELRNSYLTESEIDPKEISISTSEISTWTIHSVLSSEIVRIQSERSRLIRESSYFRGLLTGNFSESSQDCVSVEWNVETFIDVLKHIYGCFLDITANNFILLLEAAIFFGVDALLLECKTWLTKETTTKWLPSMQMDLEFVINSWNFGSDHAIDFIPELCAGYLARNFMWIISSSSFVNVPYKLLYHCVEHPHLTVDSEKCLAEAILVWIDSNNVLWQCSDRNTKYDCLEILQKVRLTLLPLDFAAGKRRNLYFSMLAEESIRAIVSMIKDPSTRQAFKDAELRNIRIRLTKYTERIVLSGCPQITLASLLLSVLPSLWNMDPLIRKKYEDSITDLHNLQRYPSRISKFPILPFEAVQEVDISKCPGLRVEAVIQCFSKSFPSLRRLNASHCFKFGVSTLFDLVEKCPLVEEVDLTADISPALPTLESTTSSATEMYHDSYVASYFKKGGLLLSKLTLEGRSNIIDLGLQSISAFALSLSFLNLKGCTSVTDLGISRLISQCENLKSLNVADTYFGGRSISVLISDNPRLKDFSDACDEHKHSSSLAFRLQELNIEGCMSVDATSLMQLMSATYLLKSMNLRKSSLNDDALNNFMGSSLKSLDVSDTMVCGVSLAQIVRRNPDLKILKARGCRNLCDQEGGDQLHIELKRNCSLEEVVFGWGFPFNSMETLGAAIKSLKAITVGLGASLGDYGLKLLPKLCPLLESIILNFQVISDDVVINLLESVRCLQVMKLCYCLGDLSPVIFQCSVPNLKVLNLERVIPWMTNEDLVNLTKNCKNLVELSISGGALLDSDSQHIISCGWPGLISIHLEECGGITSNGVSSFYDCKALEDLLLRHNGCGIQSNFIYEASSKLPMLRKVALDLCDANEGYFDTPSYSERSFLSIIKIARCKPQRCSFDLLHSNSCRKSVHKESIVVEFSANGLRTTTMKERV
ncbi:hypothetical protein C5167_045049 [Papaver somniferum]|uniref:BTB domain-containing protein n=1 Tax=Papaver somniferum TaxID=3469 RepID=A0A4Y7L9Q2_PAPSO|nr:BTB/POZ domain-containing protein FBL11-like [Papaver somniferum]RZC82264.1 hypothetical protein C5167_045049 [Papaver somniferum]